MHIYRQVKNKGGAGGRKSNDGKISLSDLNETETPQTIFIETMYCSS